MAISPGQQSGKSAYQVGGAEAVAPIRPGASTSITTATNTVSATATLPVDASGNAYAAYRVTSSASAWICFGSGPATQGAANAWLVTPGMISDLVPPPGTTQLSAILADAIAAGSVGIMGLY